MRSRKDDTFLLTLVGLGLVGAFFYLRRRRRADAAGPQPIFSVTINRPPREVYTYFRQLANLPRFMSWLDRVEPQGVLRSHWVARLPIGGTVEWDAELVDDRPDEKIAWQTVEGALFAHRGQVTFAPTPGKTGTEVRVEMVLGVAGMRPSAAVAKLLTRPQIKGDLRRLKQVLETGEVLVSDASRHRLPHPAQPSAAPELRGAR